MSKQAKGRGSFWIVFIVIVALVVAGYLYLRHHAKAPPPVSGQASAPAPAGSRAASGTHYPISAASTGPAAASTTPMPPLHASDADVAKTFATLSHGTLDKLLMPSDLIQRAVATIDALPGRKLNDNILPLHPPKGSFITTNSNGRTVIDARNYDRYSAYMQVLESIDTQSLVDWYVAHYALFQQAYREQGYPHGYFNDRLIDVIDMLLATPDVEDTVTLQRPNVFYTFEDPSLESLSAGQKLLLRLGPENENKIKRKLRTIRSALTAHPPKPAAAATAGAPAAPGTVSPVHPQPAS